MPKELWVYDNRVHKYSKIHRGDCTFCNHGAGIQSNSANVAGEWLGPFNDYQSALDAASETGRDHAPCNVCLPAGLAGESTGDHAGLEYGAVIFTARWPQDSNWSGEVHHHFSNHSVRDLDSAMDLVEEWAEVAAEGGMPRGPSSTIGLIHTWDDLGPVAPVAWHIPRVVRDGLFDDTSVVTSREDVVAQARERMVAGSPLARPDGSVAGVVRKLLAYTGLELDLEGDFTAERP